MHAGVLATLTQLRERFGISKGHKVVRGRLRRCARCKKLTSKYVHKHLAPLVTDRLQRVAAIQITGEVLAEHLPGWRKESVDSTFHVCRLPSFLLELVVSIKCIMKILGKFRKMFHFLDW
ncbi:hypothetical protein AVEN_124640-1 [Araneus ventricosus]|uniref:Integrase zinc-binding domain-containing protein n=1 Tax=Araneus ventricosus TaxID=182803 RepID=A0A4Y2GJB5_ARAVE|nr:hypothetical protein AVEN_124640-1 [Araneus ventricosus]